MMQLDAGLRFLLTIWFCYYFDHPDHQHNSNVLYIIQSFSPMKFLMYKTTVIKSKLLIGKTIRAIYSNSGISIVIRLFGTTSHRMGKMYGYVDCFHLVEIKYKILLENCPKMGVLSDLFFYYSYCRRYNVFGARSIILNRLLSLVLFFQRVELNKIF